MPSMRFLALEADLRKLKRQFIAEGEEELLATTRHAFTFILPMLWIVPLTAISIFAAATGLGMGMDFLFVSVSLYSWFAVALVLAMRAFIEWRYNFIVVTTEKIVVVDHRFVFSQMIRPIPLENVATTHTGSQYLGIGNCGYVTLHLSEVESGTNTQVRLDRLPKPDVIAGVIENARVLKNQRSPSDKGTASQADKVEDVQQKGVQEIPAATAGTPSPPQQPPPQAAQEQEGEQPYAPAPVIVSPALAAETGDVQVAAAPADAFDAPSGAVPAGTADAFDASPGSGHA